MSAFEFAVIVTGVLATFTGLALVADYILPAVIRAHQRGVERVRRAAR